MRRIIMQFPEGHVVRHFEATVPPGPYKQKCRSALRAWEQQLGRAISFRDFNTAAILALRASLHAKGKSRRNEIVKLILRLWRLAHAASVAAICDPPKKQSHRQKLPVPFGGDGTFSWFIRTQYMPQVIPACTSDTREDYFALIRRLPECFGRHILVAELGAGTLAEFVAFISVGRSPKTVKKYRAMFLACWRWANALGLAPTVPKMRPMSVPCNAPDAWGIDELKRIVAAASQLDALPIGGIDARLWWRAALLLVWYTAIRRGTLLRLRMNDVDLQRGVLTVPGSAVKTGKGKKFMLPPEAQAAIRAIWRPKRELLFPRPGAEVNLSRHFRRIVAAAAVRESEHHLPYWHKLRRSAATHLSSLGGLSAAVDLLGHQGTWLSQRYIDESYVKPLDAAKILPAVG